MHPIDIAIVAAYLAVVLLVGRRASAAGRRQDAFFLADRRFGKLYQFILNFGNTTDANTAVSTVSFVYRDGVSGVWLQLQNVFLNPYYWFMHVWFRRVRLVTTAELFELRLRSRRLAWFYSAYQAGVAITTIGFSNFVAYKITAALEPGIDPFAFYVCYVAIIGTYIAMGGLVATAFNQVFQGVLILAFSVMLLPAGWRALSGMGTLRERLPQRMFDLLGSPGSDQITWYALLAIVAVTAVQINANLVNMSLGGSARTESAARFGAVSGTYAKRIMIVLWTFVGLIAAALLQGGSRLSDPDSAWGVLSRSLLGPGWLGLMLAGVLAANMSANASKTVAVSALFVRNICRPFDPDMDDARAVFAGRVAIVGTLVASISASLAMRQVLAVTKFVLTLNLPFGAAILLMFFWRRLTRAAVWWCILLSVVVILVVPFGAQAVPALRSDPALTAHTRPDVAGVADPGNRRNGTPLFFETVSPRDPEDPASPFVGRGRFNLEAWILSRAGLDLSSASRSDLFAAQFFFDALFPFAVLIGASLLTRPPPEDEVERFFGIMRTPVGATPEEEAAAMEATRRDPGRFDHRKLFFRSSWEFAKWDREDTVGFLSCCAISGGIVAALWWTLQVLR